ncbi:MAG: hypothetical protein LBJ62_09835 [Bifidobacteriaceae bacterium]|jgi:hypothetical protein|nr:hypothetical protein [Bifidobacteriaceae bacterium]
MWNSGLNRAVRDFQRRRRWRRSGRLLVVVCVGVALVMVFFGLVLRYGWPWVDGSSWTEQWGVQSRARSLRVAGYTEQAAFLADGKVTAAELEGAYRLFVACMEEGGLIIKVHGVNPVDGFDIRYESTGERFPVADPRMMSWSCEQRYSREALSVYRETQPKVMAPELRQAVAQCLAGRGFQITGKETNADDFATVDGYKSPARLLVVEECVIPEVRRLYPYADFNVDLER